MRRRLSRHLALLLIAGASLGGCVQATRHSNTMVFGTNTTFGLSAGQDVSGIPSMTVGYRRQEAVVMPLVANAGDNGNYQTPCQIALAGMLAPGEMHPCILVGRDGSKIDTYSVLASFGAQFEGDGTQGTAGGGLAQFFSTGVAAQALAVRGGAALVATGRAAERQNAQEVAPALSALLNSPEVTTATNTRATSLQSVRAEARSYFTGITADDEFSRRFTSFATSLGDSSLCTSRTRAQCLEDFEGITQPFSPEELKTALDAARGNGS
jgi:hypothetical protein